MKRVSELGEAVELERLLKDAERQVRDLEARVTHQQALASELARHGFKGAAAEVLILISTLQDRLRRNRHHAAMMRRGSSGMALLSDE